MSHNTLDNCDVCCSDTDEVKDNTCLGDAYDETWNCNTCDRFKVSREPGDVNLGDGRQLCSDCSSISVMNEEEYNFIIENVFQFYRSLNLKVDENILILFIDNNQMSTVTATSALGAFVPSISACIARGLANDLPAQIRIILSKLFLVAVLRTEKYSRGGGNIKKAIKLLLRDAILVLFGKPNVEMGGILAHEIMHAWFNLQGTPWKREISVEEGMCEVMYYKWLQWFSSTGFDSSHKTNKQAQYTLELKEFLAEMIECQTDEVYGQGFKNAMRAIETFGFKTTLDHIVKNGTLPVVPPPVPYSTTTITPTKLVRKKTTSTPIIELLWKATINTAKSLWNTTAALLWKTTATCETPRFIIMEGHCHHHYHQGQSHTILHGGLSTSPALLVFIGILIEHK
ncbi:hypothetical protein M0R45_026066 [Rubus argutus]|uniref:Protein DA1-like domain-containing protein n=1 Tax=Rubus argutus TaxID=59490 RepID=A0AAW1WZT5_RUBAR